MSTYLGIFPYVLAAFALLYVYKLIHDGLTPFNDHDEMARGNVAAALTRAAAYLGVVIAMSGSLIGSEQEYVLDLSAFLVDGVLAILIFTVACYIFDRVFLPQVDNAVQVQQGNLAVAIMEAFGYVALGIIMSASFSGEGLEFWSGLGSALVFSTLGLATLTVIYLVYDKVLLRHRDVDREICDGNQASAIEVGSLLLAMSVTLWFSISGDYTGWGNDLQSYASAAVVSVIAVALSRALARCLVAPNLRSAGHSVIQEGNLAQATIIGAASIGIGFLVGLVVFM